MIYLQILSFFVPPAIYFVLAYCVFEVFVGLYFFLGLIGSFLIGTGICKKIESKVFQIDTHTSFVLLVLGATVASVSLLLSKNQVPIDEQAAFLAFARTVGLTLIIIGYIIFSAYLKNNIRFVFNVVAVFLFVSLGVLTVTVYFVSSLTPIYLYSFLFVAACSSAMNFYCTVKTNLYHHKAPFVLYKKIDGYDKHTDIFSDIIAILFPLIFAVVQII